MATRMQQRRGTAQQWTDADPILAAGEIGFETDTNQFKIGDGVNAWSDLSYFKNLEDLGGSLDDYVPVALVGEPEGVASLDATGKVPASQIPALVGLDTEIASAVSTAVSNLVDGAPAALNTLNEIATILGDSSNITGNIISQLGQLDESVGEIGPTVVSHTSTLTTLGSTVSGHTTTLSEQGEQISTLETNVENHGLDTTNVHGILDTAALATITYADGVAATVADSKIGTHTAVTTSVHGISNTANLVYTSDSRLSDERTPSAASVTAAKIASDAVTTAKILDANVTAAKIASDAVTTAKIADSNVTEAKIADGAVTTAKIGSGAVTKSMVGLGSVDNTADSAKPISTATQAALDLKAPIASPTFTGTLTVPNLTVTGTTTTVNSTNLEITDPLIYIGTGNSANANDLGVVGHFDNGTYQHTGIVRDATDGKWKLFSGVTTEPSGTVDFTTWTKDALVIGALEATTVTPSSGIVFSDGTQTKEGTPSQTPIVQKTASYTLSALTERDSMIEVASSSATTVTIPANSAVAYPVGTSIDILQTSTGQVTIAAGAGVTVNATPGLKLRTQWSSATLFKRATDTWVVYGDLMA